MKRKCKACRKPATMLAGLHPVCSVDCGIAIARKMQPAHEKRKRREAKESVKSPKELKAEVQEAFNWMIRARDAGKPCISCRHPDNGTRQRQAGHYRTVGAMSSLRYDPRNCHGQCVKCNKWDGGGLHPGYKAEMAKRMGADVVEWLDGPHEPKHYTREELQHMKRRFNAQARRYLRMPLEQRWTYESE